MGQIARGLQGINPTTGETQGHLDAEAFAIYAMGECPLSPRPMFLVSFLADRFSSNVREHGLLV